MPGRSDSISSGRPWIAVGRHYPHEVLLLAWSVLIGFSYIAGVPRSDSLASQVNSVVIVLWSALMAVSGVFGLVGCYWPRRFDVAVEIERGALLMQTAGLLVFTTALFAQAGFRATTAGGICIAWGMANLSRAWNITKAISILRRETRTDRKEG